MKMLQSMVVSSLLALTVMGCAPGADVGETGAAVSAVSTRAPTVIPNVRIGDRSLYGVVGQQWWQWAFGSPAVHNPTIDTTGADCAVGQRGKIWFLAGTFNSSDSGLTVRRCTMPAGKTLFFPIANVAYDPFGVEPPPTNLEMQTAVRDIINDITNMVVVVDGVSLQNLTRGRGGAGPFSITLPPGNFYQVLNGFTSTPPRIDNVFMDGFWTMLAPLRPGTHTVRFEATFRGGYIINTSYILNIVDRDDDRDDDRDRD
jgi:hypothetical protein